MRRAQVFSLDFVIAIIIFVICMAFVASFWQNSAKAANMSVLRDRLAYSASSAQDMLLSGPGIPDDWESSPSNVQSIGIARQHSKNELSKAKLSNFTSLDYGDAKRLLGFPGSTGFYFYVEREDGARLYESGNQSISAREITAVSRPAVLDGDIVMVRMLAYQ